MAQIREIRKRSKAVGTIERITKTMQMIATAKFTAALQRAKATQPYTHTIKQLVGEMAQAAGDMSHPLIDGPSEPQKRELLLTITSDRGLCGAFNAGVFRLINAHVRQLRGAGIEFDMEAAGKKAVGFFRFVRIELREKHLVGDKPSYEQIDAIAQQYIELFESGRYDAVRVAYMRFESNSRQVPEMLQLLPLRPDATGEDAGGGKSPAANYELSPSGPELLGDLLPLTVKSMLFQAFNDAVVSEQIMRMIAMKAATENAKDLGRMLTRQFNRARQAQITTELSEIIGGTAALE